ncbi:hypothetical protein RB595_006406 [Gaeumannomyces hyphopodioides]
MMAAEASLSNPVDAATTSTEPIITISADSQDVDPSQPRVNGAASSDEIGGKQLSDIVDDLVNSAEVSVSGGSDTEASKPDGTASKYGDKAHSRTSSAIKKPATFKSVSVNRTFLGSKTPAAAGSITKALDKPSSASSLSTQQSTGGASSAARPRLVAKLGVSRDGSKGPGGVGGKAAGAPDPSAVWNKNRPPPPPEPKKFTDEELKKYGIHMTDRLAPGNDAAGQNNWADIDDDDEDWVPGEIQWNDGTRVTIPQVDEPQESPKPAPAIPAPTLTTTVPLKDKVVLDKPKSPAPSASPSTKPAIGVLGSGKGLVLKGAPEKPTLVARPPPPPAPIKSPWATLPPVEKAPLENAPPHGLGRPPVRDGPPTKSMTPPPAKEIAADDFSRSGGPVSHNRELFDSRSGRYEPVAERRGAPRNDVYQRHPASVLQRPPHGEGPAEPSPAFQTNRPGPPEAPYGRRRGSSNVSGGSGTYMQRLNKPHDQMMPPPDLANVRRGSLASDSPVSPRNFSPSGSRYGPHGASWHARTSPHISNAVPHNGPGPQDSAMVPPPNQIPQRPLEDEFELQKKLMAEKLQLARQRRAEEEAKEEAEKQKRIAARLAALGPAPESRSAKQAAAREVAASSAAAPPAPSSSQNPPSQAPGQDQAQATSQDSKPAESKVSSTRPTSDADGANASADPPSNGPRRLPANENPRRAHPLASGDGRPSTTQDGKQPSWQGSSATQHESRQAEPRFSWGPSPVQTSARNLWAAPNSNRTLGNGTFVSDLGRVPETLPPHLHQMPVATAQGPGPIGPPGPVKQQPPLHPKPIAPPKVAHPPTNQRSGASDDDVRSKWAKAAMASDEKMTGEARDRLAQQKADLEARGIKIEDVRPAFRDSWKPVQLDSDGRRVESKDRVSVVHGATWRPPPTEDHAEAKPSAGPALPSSKATPSAATSLQTRGSRFFPSKDNRPDGAAHAEAAQRGSPSPPPPDMDGHPAFDGDATHPHVALPPSRPVVRLPPSTAAHRSAAPAAPAPSSAPPTMNSGSSFSWATPKPFQENPASPTHARGNPTSSVQRPTSSWQTKIHDLLHDTKSSPARTAVDSTSRGAMDSSASHNQATVSLPGFAGSAAVDRGSPTSKDMAEECFEEQEMGSLPPVRLPASAPDAAWHPAVAPGRGYPKKFCISATTVEAVEDAQPNFAFVLMPGMPRSRRVHLPSSMRSYSNPSRPSRGPRNPGSRQNSGVSRGGPGGVGGGAGGNGPRPRDTSMTSYTTDGGSIPPSSSSTHGAHATSTGRGRGGFRRSADWGRRAPTPVQT